MTDQRAEVVESALEGRSIAVQGPRGPRLESRSWSRASSRARRRWPLFTASWHGRCAFGLPLASTRPAKKEARMIYIRGYRVGRSLGARDNTNHYHRLITGITANIEIMCSPARCPAGSLTHSSVRCSRLLSSLLPRPPPPRGNDRVLSQAFSPSVHKSIVVGLSPSF